MSADAIGGEDAIRALQQATKTIPIVALADDMLGNGFVNSLSRPNGNTTGVSILAQVLDGKRQDILIEAVPGLRRGRPSPMSTTQTLRRSRHCKRRHAPMMSSF